MTSSAPMSELDFILEHGRLLIGHAIKPALLERGLNHRDDADMAEAYDALQLTEHMAYLVGRGQLLIDIEEFLQVYPEYQNIIWDSYDQGWGQLEADIAAAVLGPWRPSLDSRVA